MHSCPWRMCCCMKGRKCWLAQEFMNCWSAQVFVWNIPTIIGSHACLSTLAKPWPWEIIVGFGCGATGLEHNWRVQNLFSYPFFHLPYPHSVSSYMVISFALFTNKRQRHLITIKSRKWRKPPPLGIHIIPSAQKKPYISVEKPGKRQPF